MIVLQKFGFKESKYERPQDAWVCGRLADGKPCELGPGLDGRCRVTTVCQPRLEGERWQCRRSAGAGGPCQAGPLPDGQCCMTLERCVPRPSLRTKRKRGAVAALALMIGILAAMLGGKAGQQFMMPGKLSSPHAGLTNCSACHAGARSGQVDLLHRLFTAVEPRQNSNLCVTCHVMGSEPFAPHTHSVEDLKRVTESLRRDSKNAPPETLMQRIAFPGNARSQRAEAEIQCATCHKEHQGVFTDLTTVSNQRCQTCHVSRFGSFANSHPQFANFPYRRRPRIIFDHQSHMKKHFAEAAKAATSGQVVPDSCTDCHQPGVRRRYMEVKSFATMCSGCHNGDITGATQVSGPKGIDVITVPGLDLATLSARGIDIGGWPKESEAELTPFMGLLLEPKDQPVVSDVKGLNLLDLRRASDQDLARVARLAWAVKRLFKQLETTNPAARMLANDATGSPVDRGQQLAALTGAMSNDVIAAGSREWFPNLRDDLERHDRGDPTRDFKPPVKAPAAAEKTSQPASGGDNAAAPTKMPDASSSNDILSPDSGADGNKADILAPNNDAKVPNSGSKEDILSPSNKADILAPGTKDDILNPNNKDDILSADKATGDNSLSGAGGNAALTSAEPKGAATNAGVAAKKSAAANTAPFDPEVWGQAGGWYREDFAIRYRPTGHADQFLQTWLDFAGQAYGTSRLRDQMNPVFDVLAPRDAIGRCTKCHSVDDQAGAKIVNWQPFNPNAINNRFTNYSHKPHVELIGAQTCVKCHELRQTESQFLKTYDGGDPASYTPNFKYLDKSVCSACHSQQVAWESCTLCHGYHVPDANSGSSRPALPTVLATGTETSPLASDDARRDYDMAVQQMAKPGAVAPGQSAVVVPAISPPTAPDNSATATPNTAAPPAPAKSASVSTAEPTDPDSFYRRGHQRAVSGALELAIQDFGEVIRRDPNHAAALNDRCWVRALLDELQAALADCDMSLKVQPSFPDALDSRGLVNLKLGLYKKAIGDYTAALLYNPKRASALYGRGIAEQRSGDAAHAKSDVAAAKSIQATIVDEFAGYGVQ